MDNPAQEPLYHGCECQFKLRGGKMRDDKVAQHLIFSVFPAPLIIAGYNIASFHILDGSDLVIQH